MTEETTLPAALLMNLIFLCGLFTFAVVLGFVSEEIKSQLRSVKAGNYAGMSLTSCILSALLAAAPMLLVCTSLLCRWAKFVVHAFGQQSILCLTKRLDHVVVPES